MRRSVVRTLLEAGVVMVLGLAVGLIANAADERRGISLRKDHLAVELKQDSPFQFIDHVAALAAFQDPGFQTGEVIFIDARDDAHYAEGHIPGAYQLDHYRSERYLPELVPICDAADRIVIYCNGGACEDSQLAAEDLMLQGVDPTRLLVYEAGIAHWRAQKLPIELGQRLSGDITTTGADAED